MYNSRSSNLCCITKINSCRQFCSSTITDWSKAGGCLLFFECDRMVFVIKVPVRCDRNQCAYHGHKSCEPKFFEIHSYLFVCICSDLFCQKICLEKRMYDGLICL